MTTELLSTAPHGGINEDLLTVIEGSGRVDLIVLDGATSVADTNHIDTVQGDVAWFTHAFAAELALAIGRGLEQAQAVPEALAAVRAHYLAAAGGRAIPLYAYPLAALTWIRVQPRSGHLAPSRSTAWATARRWRSAPMTASSTSTRM
ncbi:hypothetical protein G4G28_03900 [Massilia sp. Dwa41.01b]|uniref:hypothetical protein n=1 Tax=Massilia sp. Dwa41.01b TaxID=2709302 RepID=UPI001604649A|nr:hypothetical protein [Massilia sp. Dwa41.01b]QNA87820.1 hypothetical protein G4G28_03900 [Massilia sp. Dwa41.01b]